MAKQPTTTTQPSTWADLDASAQLLPGKRVYYQLTDDEGRTDTYYKVPAVISKVEVGEREGAQLVADLDISRSADAGGSFDKVNVPFDNSRGPGTFDTIQPGDFTN